MYGDMSAEEIDALLNRNRYGRIAFSFGGESYVIPMNYAYDGVKLYCQAPIGTKGQIPGGTKIAGMRQSTHVAFQVDEIENPAHWRSVLLQGRFHELHDPAEKQAAFGRIVAQAGGGERSEVSWGMDLDQLVVFTIDITERHGRFEQREAYDRRPLPKGPLPPRLITG